jgi:acyl-CoA synthetase (AMP-forming)/AMP-acid ligase II
MDFVPLATEPILPGLIDYRLRTHPDSTFAIFPSGDDELGRITFLEFGRACQRFARIIAPGAPLESGHVVAVVLNCDTLQYLTAIGGLTYAGLAVSSYCEMYNSC